MSTENKELSENEVKIQKVKESISKLEEIIEISNDMKSLADDKRFKYLITEELLTKEAKIIIDDLSTIQRSPDDERAMLDKLKALKLLSGYITSTIQAGVSAETTLIREKEFLTKLVNADYNSEDSIEIGEDDE